VQVALAVENDFPLRSEVGVDQIGAVDLIPVAGLTGDVYPTSLRKHEGFSKEISRFGSGHTLAAWLWSPADWSKPAGIRFDLRPKNPASASLCTAPNGDGMGRNGFSVSGYIWNGNVLTDPPVSDRSIWR
jgi:hypothetical protein